MAFHLLCILTHRQRRPAFRRLVRWLIKKSISSSSVQNMKRMLTYTLITVYVPAFGDFYFRRNVKTNRTFIVNGSVNGLQDEL